MKSQTFTLGSSFCDSELWCDLFCSVRLFPHPTWSIINLSLLGFTSPFVGSDWGESGTFIKGKNIKIRVANSAQKFPRLSPQAEQTSRRFTQTAFEQADKSGGGGSDDLWFRNRAKEHFCFVGDSGNGRGAGGASKKAPAPFHDRASRRLGLGGWQKRKEETVELCVSAEFDPMKRDFLFSGLPWKCTCCFHKEAKPQRLLFLKGFFFAHAKKKANKNIAPAVFFYLPRRQIWWRRWKMLMFCCIKLCS